MANHIQPYRSHAKAVAGPCCNVAGTSPKRFLASLKQLAGLKRHGALLLILMAMSVVSTGCVRRRMTVRTSPPGATVSIDNQLIGTSPASTDFIYYGTREVRVEREGYRTEVVLRKMKPPWYQLPVLDFVSETLWPGEIRDERIIDIELVPQVIEPSEDVLNRAEALRNQSRSGIIPAG